MGRVRADRRKLVWEDLPEVRPLAARPFDSVLADKVALAEMLAMPERIQAMHAKRASLENAALIGRTARKEGGIPEGQEGACLEIARRHDPKKGEHQVEHRRAEMKQSKPPSSSRSTASSR